MANLNKVFLIGNLTRDPELRYIPSGTAVATFSIATNRVYTTQSGEKKKEVCFVRIVVWGRPAEVCGEYLSKGSPIFIEGMLQYRSWDGPNGEKRNTLEVRAEKVQLLGKGPGKATDPQADQSQTEEIENINLDDELQAPEKGKAMKSNKNDDEVPF